MLLRRWGCQSGNHAQAGPDRLQQMVDAADQDRTTDRFVEMMSLDYFKLLDTVTIARSRRHIEKYYNLDEIGKFPTRLMPINVYPEIDTRGRFPPIENINKLIKADPVGLFTPGLCAAGKTASLRSQI